jgi:hypothetical protein
MDIGGRDWPRPIPTVAWIALHVPFAGGFSFLSWVPGQWPERKRKTLRFARDDITGGPRFDQDDKKRPRYIFIQNERRSRMLQNGQTSHIPWPFEKFSSYPYNPFATTSLYVFEFGYKAPTHHLKESSL